MMNKQMLINGNFVPASDGAVLESTSPIDGRLLGTFPSRSCAGGVQRGKRAEVMGGAVAQPARGVSAQGGGFSGLCGG